MRTTSRRTDDVDVCLAAGFTGFTIDPGEHVWSGADAASPGDISAAVAGLPWDVLADTEPSLTARYAGKRFDVGGAVVAFEREAVLRAAAKYGRAVAHVVRLYRHLLAKAGEGRFEVEVSVDETDSPTSHAEHYYVASELRRLGVAWIGLAPRYVGRFEKGVDYIGDLAAFERDLEVHAHISRAMGPYKLSLHSGSDKFAIYPMVAAHSRGFVHLKTAGTSYLEALRALAQVEPEFFREIYAFCRGRYEIDKASYHVSATLDNAPAAEDVHPARAARAARPVRCPADHARDVRIRAHRARLRRPAPVLRPVHGGPGRPAGGLRRVPRAALRPPPRAVRFGGQRPVVARR